MEVTKDYMKGLCGCNILLYNFDAGYLDVIILWKVTDLSICDWYTFQ